MKAAFARIARLFGFKVKEKPKKKDATIYPMF